METQGLFERYCELQRYVGWSEEDAARVARAWPLVEPYLPALIEDFYSEIERHPTAGQVITGGPAQVARLKQTLWRWLRELFAGEYGEEYVARRWKVGRKHVEIGLDQVYTNVALSRMRHHLRGFLRQEWTHSPDDLFQTLDSLDRLIDLDLAIIEDAYQAEYLERRRQIERLATIGQVAGGVAHELRNPLNVVKTSVYYLRHAKNPTEAKKAEHLERIERQVLAADRVISALNDFAKLPLPEFRAVALEPLLRDALEQSMLPENIHVVLDVPPPAHQVLGDERQLSIVFANLIRNARDAMPDGGELRIVARPLAGDVAVTVTDTGHGIKAEDLGRITEPLFSTKVRGIGLGLAIARAILDKHSAGLTVESEEGHGAAFTVRLPAPHHDEAPS
jgi:signal transduction histidine kinase